MLKYAQKIAVSKPIFGSDIAETLKMISVDISRRRKDATETFSLRPRDRICILDLSVDIQRRTNISYLF